MANETNPNTPVEGSNTGAAPKAARAPFQQDTSPITTPEVHILEEHVVHAAKKPTTPAPAPASPPKTEPAPAPLPPVVPPAAKAEPPKPAAPVTAPKAVTPPVSAAPMPPALKSEVPKPVVPSVSVPTRPLPQQEKTPALGDDIAKILKDVKLPERFDKKGAADVKTTPVPAPPQSAPLQETVATPAHVPPVVTPHEAEKKADGITAVHTLKDDLQGVVREQRMSVVRAVSLEEDRRARKTDTAEETPAVAQRSRRTVGIIFSALLFVLLGSGAIFGVFTVMNQQQTRPQTQTTSSILFAEQSVLLSLDVSSANDLKRTLGSARISSTGTLGSITRIIPVVTATGGDAGETRPTSFKEFITAIGARPPEELLRALGDDFFLGLHTVDKNAPILIVPVTDHSHAFAGMLAWEETLNADLAPLFLALPTHTTDAEGHPAKRVYEDLIMRNYDVRALKDDAGTVQFFYSFPSQNILIIAESPYSFTEILSRLQASRQL